MPASEQYAGRLIGNYRLKRRLGAGGFAGVYLGEHIHLGTPAAIKILHRQPGEAELRKFRREARIIASLRHPHIVNLLDFGIDGQGLPYLIMEYAPAGSLRTRHPLGTLLEPREVLSIIEQVAPALDFAHSRGVVHRDVKPENLLIGQQDTVLLSDFGIATFTPAAMQTSLLVSGTPELPGVTGTTPYMAPEQIRGRPVAASDQYALAVIVYEWLCGRRPFRGSTHTEIMLKHIQEAPPPLRHFNPAIAPALEDVVLTALAKEPAQRFPTVGDFVRDYELALRPPMRPRNVAPAAPSGAVAPDEAPPQGAPRIRRASAPPVLAGEAGRGGRRKMIAVEKPQERRGSPARPTRRRLVTGLIGLGAVVLTSAGIGSFYLQGRLAGAPGANSAGNTQTGKNAGTANTEPTNVPFGFTFQVYRGHTDVVNAVAWSSDGNYIVSGGRDKIVHLWNANTSQTLLTYKKHDDIVSTVAWSPDTKYIASGGFDRTVQIWDRNGQNMALDQYKAIVFSVSWSSSGNRIVLAGQGGEVQIYEAPQGKNVSHYSMRSNYTYVVAWSPDGTKIAAGNGGSNEQVQVWDVVNGRKVASYTGHVGPVYALAWSPDGKLIASGGYDKKVHLWKADSGERVREYADHKDVVHAIAWSDDYIASGSDDGAIKIWTASNGIILHKYSEHHDSVKALVWSPDGMRVASASADKTVRIWQAI
ncbi:MAG: serine/threonine protein kinase [Ktedonobacteraceae bacterium]|nr:serine/threonine protein kinase [Ktedonobacteraceae bacterium]